MEGKGAVVEDCRGAPSKLFAVPSRLTSKSAIVTRASPTESAVRYSCQSDWYRTLSADLRVSFDQSERLLETDVRGVNLESLDEAKARELLVAVGLDMSHIDDAELTEIVSNARRSRNPYPN